MTPRLKEDGVNRIEVIDSLGRKQEAIFISEQSLLEIINLIVGASRELVRGCAENSADPMKERSATNIAPLEEHPLTRFALN